MHTDETADFFPWLQSNAAESIVDFKMPQVKEESQTDFSSLFSPPSSPYITPPSLTSVRQRTTKSESPRTRPYPELHRSEDIIGMSGTSGSGYDSWNSRSHRSSERRSSDGDQPVYQSAVYDTSNPRAAHLSRSSSASSSSLSGAVGAAPSGSRFISSSPRPRGYDVGSMDWPQQQMPSNVASDASMYPGVAGNVSYPSPSEQTMFGGYDSSALSFTNDSYRDTTSATNYMMTPSPNASSSHSQAPTADDLHRRIAELEQRHRHDKEQIIALQAQLASSSSSVSNMPTSPSFEASWRARTEARVRQFCSLNRAGNALCAWHDSRRERRMYPPRMAPPGTLNCGCTYEEALFEESLARHSVGSYLPSNESVRMDPALRNPLLKLLQQRYNYRDGDFERNPSTGHWLPGEGHVYWEQQAASGLNPRRAKGDQSR